VTAGAGPVAVGVTPRAPVTGAGTGLGGCTRGTRTCPALRRPPPPARAGWAAGSGRSGSGGGSCGLSCWVGRGVLTPYERCGCWGDDALVADAAVAGPRREPGAGAGLGDADDLHFVVRVGALAVDAPAGHGRAPQVGQSSGHGGMAGGVVPSGWMTRIGRSPGADTSVDTMARLGAGGVVVSGMVFPCCR
jgi:hypothetical protein